jgi:hypothetical protein
VRTLTPAEGRVIAVLLGATPANERERLHQLALPRSTYHAARRRAYGEGWIRDRYVPDPARFGYSRITFLLGRPFADRAEELGQRWSRMSTNVLTWMSPQIALGVFYHAREVDSLAALREVLEGRLASHCAILSADATAPEMPVYFDYEGLWTNLAAMSGTSSYPHGLGGSTSSAPEEGPAVTPHQRWAASELVHRPFVAEAAGRGGHLVGPFGLAFSQLRLLRSGWVTHRVFLDVSRVPAYRGRSADEIVFVTGALREGRRAPDLFATLTRDCRVFPFLYITHGGRILLGALGRAPGSPAPAEGTPLPRRSVMATLQESLEGIEVLQEPAAQFRTLVDHRYDRILPRRAA